MPFEVFLNQTASGLLTGLVYGLSALGLSVIFGVVRIVNFAHGEMMVVAMYIALLLFQWLGLEPLLAVVPVAAILFLVGYGLQAGIINRLIDVPDTMQFLLLAAVGIVLTAGCMVIFGPDARNVTLPYSYDSVEVGALLIDKPRLLAGAAALIISALLFLFFRFTRTGKQIRACADNIAGARVVGLNVKRLYAISLGIGSMCIGAAGSIILMLVDVHPYLAGQYTLLAFVIVIVGGMGSHAGALLGGVLIGVSEALAGLLLQPSLKTVFSYAILILVLLFRPQGLLGRRA